jgi:hypothetical protein
MNQINGIGSKHQLIIHLDIIASQNSFLRPTTKFLKFGDDIPKSTVVKRSHSDCGEHVLMPEDDGRNWHSFSQYPKIPGSVWFAQSHISTLRKHGEWRVIIIGGQPVYTVHTKYNEAKSTWSWEVVDSFYSLEEILSVIF